MAPYFEPYSEYLAERGYSQVAYWHKTFLINEFSRWLSEKQIAASEITAEHEAGFLRYNAGYRRPKLGDPTTLSGIAGWLQEKGVIESRRIASFDPVGIGAILQEYKAWLRQERGLAPASIENYAGYVGRFLKEVFGATELYLTSLRADQITDYIRRLAPKDRTFAAAKHIVTALRSFVRFARYRDYILIDLAAMVPSVAGWSMASIPRAMPTEQVKTLLAVSKTWQTPAGLRNRAVLLLLARLGLRAGEIIRLELDDVDWSEGFLRVPSKGRAESPMPLPHDVGEAIAAYLEHGRPRSACRKVFLRSHAPFDALKSHSDICMIVRRAIMRAGIESMTTGAHQLRHALAVDMLRRGTSLTDIGQVLRHRSPETTRRYAKVDLEALREVALPWPEAMP